MKIQFADTAYFLALLIKDDEFHERAEELAAALNSRILTTTWVLVELASGMRRPRHREIVSSFIQALPFDPNGILAPALQSEVIRYFCGGRIKSGL